MRSATILLILIGVITINGDQEFSCPRNCQCSLSELPNNINYANNLYDVKCSSIDNFGKLVQHDPKHAAQIRKLDISNIALKKLNTELINKLKNLQVLNASLNEITDLPTPIKLIQLTDVYLERNQIKTISLWFFPKSVQNIDLSFNNLAELPDNIAVDVRVNLPKLKYLSLQGNHLECSCHNRKAFDTYFKHRIMIDVEHCWDSFKFESHTIKGLTQCVDTFADEGSGDDSLVITDEDDTMKDDFNEFLNVNSSAEKNTPTDFYFPPDGSGDDSLVIPEMVEGSGSEPSEPSERFISSTTEPSSSSFSSFFDGSGDSEEDEFDLIDEDSNQSTTTSKFMILPPVFEETTTEFPKQQVEEVFVKQKMEVTNKEVKQEENLGQIVDEPLIQSAYSTYIFLAILVVLIVCLVGYTCIKRSRRRSPNNRRYQLDNNTLGTELKDVEHAYKPDSKSNGISNENTPMITPQPTNGSVKTPEEVPLTTNHYEQETSSPKPQPRNNNEAEKVRITLTELTDSIPRTPKLVIRTKSSVDDKIILTPNLSQRPSFLNNNPN